LFPFLDCTAPYWPEFRWISFSNTLSVVGLVTIPGMMTGRLLSGTSLLLAARYQLMILFLVAVATGLGVAAVFLVYRRLFDQELRLRRDRLRARRLSKK
jgi:putative ABC transport system permease protein